MELKTKVDKNRNLGNVIMIYEYMNILFNECRFGTDKAKAKRIYFYVLIENKAQTKNAYLKNVQVTTKIYRHTCRYSLRTTYK